MPPVLILALIAACLALLDRDKTDLDQEQQEDLKKLQDQLAEARKSLRHAQSAKKRFIAATGAKLVTNDK